MNNSEEKIVPPVIATASTIIDPDALAFLKKQVADGLDAPVDEKVRSKDFSDFMIDFEGETR